MYRHYTAVRSVPRKLRAIEGFSHKGESVKRGSTVHVHKHEIMVSRAWRKHCGSSQAFKGGFYEV